MKKLCIVLGASLIALTGCGGDDKPIGAGDTAATILVNNKNSGVKEQAAEQAHNQADFQQLWDEAYAGHTEPPLPTVDFTKNTVVAYFLGEMKHGGFVLRVDRAEATADG